MRIVLIGVSHWHTPFYLDPLLALPDVAVIGVSDPDLARAAEIAAKARCPAFADYREGLIVTGWEILPRLRKALA